MPISGKQFWCQENSKGVPRDLFVFGSSLAKDFTERDLFISQNSWETPKRLSLNRVKVCESYILWIDHYPTHNRCYRTVSHISSISFSITIIILKIIYHQYVIMPFVNMALAFEQNYDMIFFPHAQGII